MPAVYFHTIFPMFCSWRTAKNTGEAVRPAPLDDGPLPPGHRDIRRPGAAWHCAAEASTARADGPPPLGYPTVLSPLECD